ncbi:MAG: hypothetical protein GY830_05335 [Bacteroidetes bacterium]|nr:hypothetical protein [Bacteroidota bacterium]
MLLKKSITINQIIVKILILIASISCFNKTNYRNDKSQIKITKSQDLKKNREKSNNSDYQTKFIHKGNFDAGKLHLHFKKLIHHIHHAVTKVEHNVSKDIKKVDSNIKSDAKKVEKGVHTIAKKADVVVEKVEVVTQKIGKVVHDFRVALDKFTKFAEATSLAAAIDACFEAFDLPVTLEEFDEAVDGIDDTIILVNKILKTTDTILKTITQLTGSKNTNSENKDNISKQKKYLLNLKEKSNKRKDDLNDKKTIIQQNKSKILKKQTEKLSEIEKQLSDLKKENQQNFHPFRLIYLNQEYLLELSRIIKNEETQAGTYKLLKTYMTQLQKNKNLYTKLLNFLKQKDDDQKEIPPNKLFLFTFSLINPHKKIQNVTDEDIEQGTEDIELISQDKFNETLENIKDNTFINNINKDKESLELDLMSDLQNIKLFNNYSDSLNENLKKEDYTDLLKSIKKIFKDNKKNRAKNKIEETKRKIMDLHYKMLINYIEEMNKNLKDRNLIKNDIKDIILACNEAKEIAKEITNIMDECKNKLSPHLKNQVSVVNKNNDIIIKDLDTHKITKYPQSITEDSNSNLINMDN